jgi:serine/threonine protein kinase
MIGIGKGAITVKARMANGELVAAKCIPISSENPFETTATSADGGDNISSWTLPREILLHSLLKHKRIPALIGICTKANEVLLIQELVTNSFSSENHSPSDLWSLLYLSKRRLSLVDILRIGRHILDALAYIHVEQSICHCDVQPKNILIDDSACAFLIDFGCARRYRRSEIEPCCETASTSSSRLKGCTNYLAPEVIKYNKYSPSSDIYGFGLLLLEMLIVEQPWSGQTEGEIEYQLQVNKRNALNYKPEEIREKVKKAHPESSRELLDMLLELVARTLSFRPTDRPSARILKTQLCAFSKHL